ncbi:MAG TPA: substrate-binding domain-containing protein [Pseudonocardiaceae bacterium]|nr:substrate-binding domain-containing protein [Pseudonocardiaceae bacterium]
MAGGALDVLLRAARVRAGLSQGELAARAGVTRQAVSAIEGGKAAPTMAVALRLARVLGRRVDELFRLVDELPQVAAELVGAMGEGIEAPTRVQVADVDGRLLARPLVGSSGAVLTIPRANGLIRSRPSGGRAVVDLFADPDRLAETVVAVGCDPAMGLLADHVRRRHPTVELAWQGGSSLAALETVARGEAHLAGSHLLDSASGEYNLPFARRLLGEDVRLVTFANWEQGLMVPSGNPKGVAAVGDLGRADLRIANREPGSGARALLDAELARAGLASRGVAGYGSVVRSHLAAAEAVAAGLADAAVGVRAAAQALGLGFVPLARERYDLAIPARFFELPPVQALLETLTSPLFRLEVEALGGYDVSPMGALVPAA